MLTQPRTPYYGAMIHRLPLLAVSVFLSLVTMGEAHAQVAVDEEESTSSSSTAGPASAGRIGDLLGSLGAPAIDSEKTEAPDVPERTHDSVRRCFSDAAKRDATMPGRIEVEFTLYNFDITGVSLPQGSGMDVLLRECLQEAVNNTEVEAKDGSYTWLFIPSAG